MTTKTQGAETYSMQNGSVNVHESAAPRLEIENSRPPSSYSASAHRCSGHNQNSTTAYAQRKLKEPGSMSIIPPDILIRLTRSFLHTIMQPRTDRRFGELSNLVADI